METLSKEEFEELKLYQRAQFNNVFIEGHCFNVIKPIDGSEVGQKGLVVTESFISAASNKTYNIKNMHLEDGRVVQLSYLNFDCFESTGNFEDVNSWLENYPSPKMKKKRQ